ncbi:urea ABC transporter permease subunit UrtB [Rhodobium gokarnense]|uniref:Urea transport system permease protein n=1 Tax=Rhodobium gokarnense TaxID=364296 RepID=A0ABT3H9B2_9HYPH|nr:urea ABC transporter permease subunit UrtB [Rhodobium gokarnense]MCW2306949.1 urea transport system permease protein [Rhodobium gokarnense]
MSRLFPAILALVFLALASAVPVAAAEADLAPLVQAFSDRKYDPKVEAIEKLGASGDMRAVAILKALGDRNLYYRKSDDRVVLGKETAEGMAISDPVTGEDLGVLSERALRKVRLNNRMRRNISAAIGTLTLMSPDAAIRADAAESIFQSRDDDDLETLDAALAKETDPDVKRAMEQARAAIVLENGGSDEELIAAIDVVKSRGDRDALSVLTGIASGDGPVAEAAKTAVTGIENRLELWGAAQNVFYGLSLGSVLLLAAIGLAITFGVMGVINMAHGEMIMIGAYVTFMVQELIRTSAPWLFDYSLFIALPLAFLIAGLVGMAIEHGVIRFLYGRPLETLLATWGISLILQQAVRSIFGPTNREVGTPDWMSSFFKLGELTLTYNRVYILLFSFAVLALLMLVMRYTAFGLQMRAVTQNRPMAGSMGIRTGWVDKLTFGLGSGIAGIAGVALSQIDNVSPNLGQSYIIDSFMVVVFGGVGNLWGTLVGAMTLGVANKFLEPYAGAVLAKIFVLVFIILFIQKRPRGLFALKGRAVEQ